MMKNIPREHNTDRNGKQWSESVIKAVWNKGKVIPDYSPDYLRWDKCGMVMRYAAYGNRDVKHGWEIDHINPVSNGGADEIENLQPLNWRNNAEKGDDLNWICPRF